MRMRRHAPKVQRTKAKRNKQYQRERACTDVTIRGPSIFGGVDCAQHSQLRHFWWKKKARLLICIAFEFVKPHANSYNCQVMCITAGTQNVQNVGMCGCRAVPNSCLNILHQIWSADVLYAVRYKKRTLSRMSLSTFVHGSQFQGELQQRRKVTLFFCLPPSPSPATARQHVSPKLNGFSWHLWQRLGVVWRPLQRAYRIQD